MTADLPMTHPTKTNLSFACPLSSSEAFAKRSVCILIKLQYSVSDFPSEAFAPEKRTRREGSYCGNNKVLRVILGRARLFRNALWGFLPLCIS